ncbi:MAG: hypothetical protein RB292_05305 [Patescibacteria group bacterium]|jgi:hypothetical protein|nr:hypothetical protein [Patescibacteria group bacterium]
MKRYQLITLLLITLFLTGCINNTSINQNTNEETNLGQTKVATTSEDVSTSTETQESYDISTTTEEIDTSDWLTYRNEEYGFEFKYPGEWGLHNGWVIDDNTIFIGGVQIPIKNHFDTGISIFELKNFDFSGCNEIFYRDKACIVEMIEEDYSKTIIFRKDSHILKINVYYGKFDSAELRTMFDNILLTLRFF